MKKRILLSAMMACALALSACGSGENETADGGVAAEESDAADEDASEEEETDVLTAEEEELRVYAEDNDLKSSDTVFTEAAIEETELYNADGITVTALRLNTDTSYGPVIQIQTRNDSDRTIEVEAENVVVNGYMMPTGIFYTSVAPGTTDTNELTLYNFDLDAYGIETVATVSLNIVIMDEESYEVIDTGERVTLTTSAAEGFTQPVDDGGDVIYDSDGIRVVCQGLLADDVWDNELVFYVENNTDRYIGVTAEDVSVNGMEEEYATFWLDLYADSRAVGSIYLLDIEDQDITGIKDVKEVSFTLLIIDQDAWEPLDESDPITLQFD